MDFGSARFSQDNQYGLHGGAFTSSSSSPYQYKTAVLPDPPTTNPIWDAQSSMQYQQQPSTEEHMESSPRDEGRRGDYGTHGNGGLFVEKEHMFDKVVTPSDVGKLNRLVIPKQHAEKYFPLDSSTNEKGLLLNFEDRSGKSWRFRYSYWTSSQSYVMTKGWSRFVKEKRLDAGDIVSFQRGVGEVGKDRFYIDWRRRPHTTEALNFHHGPIPHHFQLHQWSPSLMRPMGVATPLSVPRDHVHLPQNNVSLLHNPYRNSYPISGGSYGCGTVINPCHGGSVLYLRSAAGGVAGPAPPPGVGSDQAVFESVPVAHGKAAAKTLRLFGVNMECPVSESDECDITSSTTMSHSTMASEFRLYNGSPMPNMPTDFFGKGKSSMSSLDFGT